MPKVLLIEHVLAHYRRDVFRALLNEDHFNFEIIAGRNYQGIKSANNCGIELDYLGFKLGRHKFYYLKGSIKHVFFSDPDMIICTGIDFHRLHTVLIFFLFRIILRKKFYWWSHATVGNQGKFGFLIRKLIYKQSSGIFVYNEAGKTNLLSMKVAQNRIIVVNNSINRDDYGYLNFNLNHREKSPVFRLLYSGRITRAKKLDILIKALGILKRDGKIDFKCRIIGNGDLLDLKEIAKYEDVVEEIDFLEEKYGKESHPYFLDSDIFVYPGGIGLSALHAFSFGLPVITTNNLDLHFPEFELLLPGYNGDLYCDNSPEDLALKITEWKNKMTYLKDWFTQNCINRINELDYLPDKMVNKILDFLKQE